MNKTLIYASLILIGTFIASISQVMLKKAAEKKYSSWIFEYLNPVVTIAYVLFFGTTLLSVFAYKVIPLSMGPLLEATSYIYVTIFGVKIFGEKINKGKILSLILIVTGIAVYSCFG